jgi:AcrR family transcriptional regulator
MNEKEKQSRAKLIDVATQLFAEKGLDGTTTRDIANMAGINISLISYYFQGKEGLYKEVFIEFARRAELTVEQAIQKLNADGFDRKSYIDFTKKLISGMLKMKLENPHISTLLQREVLSGLPYAKEVYEQNFKSLGQKIISVFQAAQKKGIMRPDINPHVHFLTLGQSTDMYLAVSKCPLSVLEECYRIPEQLDEYIDQLYKVFIEGTMT